MRREVEQVEEDHQHTRRIAPAIMELIHACLILQMVHGVEAEIHRGKTEMEVKLVRVILVEIIEKANLTPTVTTVVEILGATKIQIFLILHMVWVVGLDVLQSLTTLTYLITKDLHPITQHLHPP